MATEILSNEGGLTLNGGKSGVSRGDYTLTVEQSGQTKVVALRSNNGKVNWTLNPIDTTVDGEDFETAEDLLIKLNSFRKGGGSTGEGVQSVNGNLVDNTDPNNPIVNFNDGMITGVNIRSSDPIVFDKTGYYTYEGDDDIVSVLPDVVTSEGKRFILFNAEGEGTWTVEGDIYESGVDVPSLTMMRGENYIIYSNGNKWMIV